MTNYLIAGAVWFVGFILILLWLAWYGRHLLEREAIGALAVAAFWPLFAPAAALVLTLAALVKLILSIVPARTNND